MAGAVFGEVPVSVFVAGAIFGEIWNDSRGAKCCIFQYKMLVVGVKDNLGCGLTVLWSNYSRMGRVLAMTFDPFAASYFSWQPQYLITLDFDAITLHLHEGSIMRFIFA